MTRPTRLVYLLAASHSGSTLTAFLLGSHPEICTAGELKLTNLGDLDRYRCSCGSEIQSCSFWISVSERLGAQGLEFDLRRPGTDFATEASRWARRLLRPLHRGPGLELLREAALHLDPAWPGRRARVQKANALLARAVCDLTGKPVIVDSSKVGGRLKYLLRNPSLDVRVVRVVRDGRAVALTYVDPARFADAADERLRGGGAGGDRAAEKLPLAEAAREWRRSNEEADSLLRRLPRDRWVAVRYEEICADPQAALRPALERIGVDPRAPISLKSGSHHVVGNGMRLDSTREIRLDERWKTALGNEDLATFDGVAGRYNRRLGYR